MPKISVVIPTKNRCACLKRAIASVCAQTFADLEIIVVNDGSSDGTREYLSSLRDPRLLVIDSAVSTGGGGARNRGIGAATGSLIAFLDDDDEWEGVKLQEQTAALEKTGADLCHTGINCYRANGSFFRYVFMRPAFSEPFKSIMNDNYLGGTSSILVTKTALLQCGNFDPELPALQDWDLYIRLAKNGCTVQGINKPLTKYHVVDSAKNISLSFSRYKSASDYLKKKYHAYPFQSLFSRRIKIIELKRCIKSRAFFLDAVKHYCNPGSIQKTT